MMSRAEWVSTGDPSHERILNARSHKGARCPDERTTRSAYRRERRGGGRDERPARGSLRCVRSSRCAARHESGFGAA